MWGKDASSAIAKSMFGLFGFLGAQLNKPIVAPTLATDFKNLRRSIDLSFLLGRKSTYKIEIKWKNGNIILYLNHAQIVLGESHARKIKKHVFY
jgi:hypothetical protein